MNGKDRVTWIELCNELMMKHERYYSNSVLGFKECQADAARGVEHAQKTLALYLARRMTK